MLRFEYGFGLSFVIDWLFLGWDAASVEGFVCWVLMQAWLRSAGLGQSWGCSLWSGAAVDVAISGLCLVCV